MSITADHTTARIDRRFDRTALKVNQAAIITLLVIAFVADLPWLLAVVVVIWEL